MQGGERDLRGADEEELVALDLVDHLALAGEEPGPVERALADQHRRDHRLEPLAADRLDREADQRQLDHHQVAEQVGEARARRRGRLLDLDPAVLDPELEVVAGLEVEARRLADLAQRDRVLLATVGGLGIGQVGERRGERVAALLDLGELGLQPLELRRHAPSSARSRSPRPRPRACAAAISLGGLVLLRAPALDLGQQLAPAGVEREQLVERLGGAAARQRRAGRTRVARGSRAGRAPCVPARATRLPPRPARPRTRLRSRRPAAPVGRPRCRRTRRRTPRPPRPRRRRRCSGA